MKKPTFKSTKLFLKVLLKSFKLFFIAGKAQLILLLFFTVIQGLVPIMIAQSTRTILDSLNILKDSSLTFAVVILVITWGFWNLINFIINPLSLHIQGNLTDKLILSCNLKALETMRRINDLSTMEESRFFDEQQLLEQELAWRPVNLIVFTFSFIRGFITVLSIWSVSYLFIRLSRYCCFCRLCLRQFSFTDYSRKLLKTWSKEILFLERCSIGAIFSLNVQPSGKQRYSDMKAMPYQSTKIFFRRYMKNLQQTERKRPFQPLCSL
jgi:hypothetical protein